MAGHDGRPVRVLRAARGVAGMSERTDVPDEVESPHTASSIHANPEKPCPKCDVTPDEMGDPRAHMLRHRAEEQDAQ